MKAKIQAMLVLNEVTKAERLIYEWTNTHVIGLQMFFELIELVRDHIGTIAYDRGWQEARQAEKIMAASASS